MAKTFSSKEEALQATQNTLRQDPNYIGNKPQSVATGGESSYWQDPTKIVRWRNAAQSVPEDQVLPDWLDSTALDQAYRWLEYKNQGAPTTEWELPDDPDFSNFLSTLPTPPNEKLLPWEQEYKTPEPTPGQAIEDPYAKLGYKKVPFEQMSTWQQIYDVLTNVNSSGPLEGKAAQLAGAALKGLGTYGSVAMGGSLIAGGLGLTGVGAPAALTVGAITQVAAPVAGIAVALNEAAPVFGYKNIKLLSDLSVTATVPFDWLDQTVRGLGGIDDELKMYGFQGIMTNLSRALADPEQFKEDISEAYKIGQASYWETRPYANAGFNLAAVIEGAIRKATNTDEGISGLEPANIGEVWKMAQGYGDPVPVLDEQNRPLYSLRIAPTDSPEVALEKFKEFWNNDEGIQLAKRQLESGKSVDEVRMDIMDRFGDSGQATNFIMSMLTDPSNFMNMGIGVGGKIIANAAGKPTLAKAFETSIGSPIVDAAGMLGPIIEVLDRSHTLHGSQGLFTTFTKYRDAVRAGETLKTGTTTIQQEVELPPGMVGPKEVVDVTVPTYKPVSELDWFDRVVGGIDEQGRIKELQPAKPTGNKFVDYFKHLSSLTEDSKAGIFLYNLFDNLGLEAVRVTDDPNLSDLEKVNRLKQLYQTLSDIDVVGVGEAGTTFLNSPTARTIAEAIKGVASDNKVKEAFVQYANPMHQQNILVMRQIADALQLPLAVAVEKLKRDPSSVFKQLRNKLDVSNPIQKDLFDKLGPSGSLNTPELLANKFALLTGRKYIAGQGFQDGQTVPFIFDDFRARMTNMVYDYGFENVKQMFNIKEQKVVYRLANVLKAAQSLVLLGLSPRYLINNSINNLVTRAAHGVFGFMTPNQVTSWWNEMGIVPARLHEGVTPTGGVSPQLAGEFAKSMQFIHDMVMGDGELAKFTRKINTINATLGIFSTLSQKVESSESVQAYTIGAKTMWNRLWQPGRGFQKMPAQLEAALSAINPDLPAFLYSTIAGHASQKSIEAALWKDVQELNIEQAIEQAIKTVAPTDGDRIRQGLTEIGALDEFKNLVKGAKTPEDIETAVKTIDYHIQELIELEDLRKAASIGEELDNILTQEGIMAIPEMFVEMQERSWDQWLQHYQDLNDFVQYVDTVTDYHERTRLWHDFLQKDQQNWSRIQEHEMQVYGALFSKKMPKGTKRLLNLIHQRVSLYNDVYEMRNNLYDEFFASEKSADQWAKIQQQVDAAFINAANSTKAVQAQIDDVLVNLFDPEYQGIIRESRNKIAQIQARMDESRQAFVARIKKAYKDPNEGSVRQLWLEFQQKVQLPLINELKAAEVEFSKSIEHFDSKEGVDGPEDDTSAIDQQMEWVRQRAAEIAKTAQEDYTTGLSRQEFRTAMKKHGFNIKKEQWPVIFRLVDLRAKQWAKENGRRAEDWYSERIAGIEGKGGLKDTLLQEEQVYGPTFYYQLDEVINAIPQEWMTIEQAKALITKGVKPEEYKWSKMQEFFEGDESTSAGYLTLQDMIREDAKLAPSERQYKDLFKVKEDGTILWSKKYFKGVAQKGRISVSTRALKDLSPSVRAAIDIAEQGLDTLNYHLRHLEAYLKTLEEPVLNSLQETHPIILGLIDGMADNISKEDIWEWPESPGVALLNAFEAIPNVPEGLLQVAQQTAIYFTRIYDTKEAFEKNAFDINEVIGPTEYKGVNFIKNLPEYTETLFYSPTSSKYGSGHFNTTGINRGQGLLGHTRWYEPMDPITGEPSLELLEVQSDLHQQGRKYKDKLDPKKWEVNKLTATNINELIRETDLQVYIDFSNSSLAVNLKKSGTIPTFIRAFKQAVVDFDINDTQLNALINQLENSPLILDIDKKLSTTYSTGSYRRESALVDNLFDQVFEYFTDNFDVGFATISTKEPGTIVIPFSSVTAPYGVGSLVNRYSTPVLDEDYNYYITRMSDGLAVFNSTKGEADTTELINNAIKIHTRPTSNNDVYNVPFQTTWPVLFIKQAIRTAIEKGKTSLLLPTGITAAKTELYAVTEAITSVVRDSISGQAWIEMAPGTYRPVNGVSKERLASYIGADIAELVLQTPPDAEGFQRFEVPKNMPFTRTKFSGFYDDILPKAVEKYLKKYGAKVERYEPEMYHGPQVRALIAQLTAKRVRDDIALFAGPTAIGGIRSPKDTIAFLQEKVRDATGPLYNPFMGPWELSVVTDVNGTERVALTNSETTQTAYYAVDALPRAIRDWMEFNRVITPDKAYALVARRGNILAVAATPDELNVMKQAFNDNVPDTSTDFAFIMPSKYLFEDPVAQHSVYRIAFTPELIEQVRRGQPLYQKERQIKGSTQWLSNSKAIINILTDHDITTPIHELMHVWRPDITEADQTILSQWSGLKDANEYYELHNAYIEGKLNKSSTAYKRYIASEEKVARGLERVIHDGVSWLPAPIAKVFAALKEWFRGIYRVVVGSPIDVQLTSAARAAFERMFVGDVKREAVRKHTRASATQMPLQPASRVARLRAEAKMKGILAQEAVPVNKKAGVKVPRILWNSDLMRDAWNGQYSPIMHAIGDQLKYQVQQQPLNFNAEIPAKLRNNVKAYLQSVYANDMPGVRLASLRYGENRRDNALLNYQRRYGFDADLGISMPYELWYTRTMANWAKLMIDKPQLYSWYTKVEEEQRKKEAQGVPSRLKDKMRILAPYLPEWATGMMYYDPMKQLFPPATFLEPLKQVQITEATRQAQIVDYLRQLQSEGQATAVDVDNAIATKSGYLWDLAADKIQSDADDALSSPTNLIGMMFGPPLWYSIADNLTKGTPEKISPTPMLNTMNAIKQVGQDTPFEGITNALSNIGGAPERWVRNKFGLNDLGQYSEVYIDRALASMAAEGEDVEQVLIAMAERKGPLYDEAVKRAQYQQNLKVPGVAMAESIKGVIKKKSSVFDIAGSLIPTAFPVAVISKGELKFREQYNEYVQAWKDKEAGKADAVTNFFEKHPEYAARLNQFKNPEQRLRNILVGQIWDALDQLEGPNKKVIISYLGTAFQETFLDKAIADNTAIDLQTLAYWARVVGASVPETPETKSVLEEPMYKNTTPDMYPTSINQAVADYWKERNTLFPNIITIQNLYYANGKDPKIKTQYPELPEYWEWNRQYKSQHPEIQSYLDTLEALEGSDETNRKIVTTADFIDWDPVLLNQVMKWVYGSNTLTRGARQELYRRWTISGRPGGTFDAYLTLISEALRSK